MGMIADDQSIKRNQMWPRLRVGYGQGPRIEPPLLAPRLAAGP